MTDQSSAAPAAEQDPLTDEYVNAVIRQHGYDSPETVIARLYQWIGLNGSENGVTLLMYEAHKALSKLRAPVADERAIDLFRSALAWGMVYGPLLSQEQWDEMREKMAQQFSEKLSAALASAPASKPKRPPVDDGICWSSKEIQRRQKEEDDARAAYHHSRASAPVAGEAQDSYALADALYHAGYNDGKTPRDYDPRGTDEWQAVVDALAAPQASEAARNAALSGLLLEIEDYLLCVVQGSMSRNNSEALASELGDKLRAALTTPADKDGGDCAKGEAKRLHGLVEEAISWLETGGGRADSLCADLRKALAAQKQGDSDA